MARRRSSACVALISMRFMACVPSSIGRAHALSGSAVRPGLATHYRLNTSQQCRDERFETKGIAGEPRLNVEVEAWARGGEQAWASVKPQSMRPWLSPI